MGDAAIAPEGVGNLVPLLALDVDPQLQVECVVAEGPAGVSAWTTVLRGRWARHVLHVRLLAEYGDAASR